MKNILDDKTILKKNAACKELNKVCRRRQDKISNGCNTSEKVKHLYLNLGVKGIVYICESVNLVINRSTVNIVALVGGLGVKFYIVVPTLS